MRVNIAWAELQQGKGKEETTVFLVRSHPPPANTGGATTCLFSFYLLEAVFRIRKVLGLPYPDPSIIKQNSKKTLDFYCLVTTL
jgi:hypothetical protein